MHVDVEAMLTCRNILDLVACQPKNFEVDQAIEPLNSRQNDTLATVSVVTTTFARTSILVSLLSFAQSTFR